MRDPEDILDELRTLRRKGMAADEKWRAEMETARAPADFVTTELRRRRSERAEQAAAVAAVPLDELRQRRVNMAKGIPGKGVPDAARTIAEHRRKTAKGLPDAAVLARTPLADLMRQADAVTEPAVLLEYVREVTFRAEQGADVALEAKRLALRLDETVLGLPDIRKFAATHDELGRIVEYSRYTVDAIASGDEDAGERYDSAAAVSAARAAGDHRPAVLIQQPDGSSILTLREPAEARDIVGAE